YVKLCKPICQTVTESKFIINFVSLRFMDMLEFPNSTKEIDESRQGEALMLEKNENGSSSPKRKLYIESYGCQMNFSDSEIVASILLDKGFETTSDYLNADVVFINTCSIRENAEQRVRHRLKEFETAK